MSSLYRKKIMTSLKMSVRLAGSTALYYSGATRMYRASRRKKGADGIAILAYHDIARESHLGLQVPAGVFERQMNYLRKENYNILSLDEAASLLASQEEIPPESVVITFDDGYKSIYTDVFPIVRKYEIPITVFVCTRPVEERTAPFVDAIIHAVKVSQRPGIDLTDWGMGTLGIEGPLEKDEASREIINRSKSFSEEERRRFRDFVFRELGVDGEAEELRDMMLNWEEIIELSREGVSFGSHTVNHPCLAGIPLEEAAREIGESKRILEEKTGREVTSFAYPYGSAGDITREVRDLVEEAGYRCSCVLGGGKNWPGEDPFLLKRKNITDHIKHDFLVPFSKADFAVQVSGIVPSAYDTQAVLPARGEGRINILFIIDQLRGMAGTERHLLYLASGLEKKRYNCYICTFDGREGVMPRAIRERGIPLLDLGLNRIYSPEAPSKAIMLWNFMRRKKIDIVQTYHFKSDTFGVLVARLAGVPCIISSKRDMGDLRSRRQTILSRVMNRYTHGCITVCDRVGERFNRTERIPREKMLTIYNGVDFERFDLDKAPARSRKELGFDESDFVIGTTAIFRPEKAYHILFEAIEMVLPEIRELKVMIMGFGPQYRHFVDYCEKGALREAVTFLGRVSDVETYLPLLDVFCLVPNRNEGFSNAILEAMAMERPVIATDVGGNAEAVVDEETGFIIPPNDAAALASRIRFLYENAGTRKAMGRKAGERAREVFSLDAMIRRHEDLYAELYSRGRCVGQRRESQTMGSQS